MSAGDREARSSARASSDRETTDTTRIIKWNRVRLDDPRGEAMGLTTSVRERNRGGGERIKMTTLRGSERTMRGATRQRSLVNFNYFPLK